jgi:hypothetical protein
MLYDGLQEASALLSSISYNSTFIADWTPGIEKQQEGSENGSQNSMNSPLIMFFHDLTSSLKYSTHHRKITQNWRRYCMLYDGLQEALALLSSISYNSTFIADWTPGIEKQQEGSENGSQNSMNSPLIMFFHDLTSSLKYSAHQRKITQNWRRYCMLYDGLQEASALLSTLKGHNEE